VLKDVTQARALARQLSHQATHDALTGLVNRQEFERRLGRALTRAREDRAEHALCYLDLDQFKVVNDTCGHLAGDELLRQVGVTLRGKMRRRDTLARLGGDEFGVLLEHCKPDQARAIAEDLRQVLQDFHFAWEGRPFTVGVSIGVAPITIETESIAAILRDADSACYAAKEKGRNRVQVAQTGDLHLAVRQGELEWVSKVTEALGENRFRLYAQPIAPVIPHLQDHPHCEVLIRLLGPNGELALPGAFIPAAERYGIMPAVDRWVVERVVAYYGERASAPSAELPIISINLSGASLSDPTLFDFIRQQLLRGSVSPHSLCFEITETAAIANLAHAVQFIRELRKLGCSFALDDFGSGLSSFAYLQTLPVDYLKIAGSFVRHIATDPIDYAMVEAISRVGQVMGVRTIAEGVETESVMDKLKEIGVDYAQGWAISEPVPIEEIERVLITR
jgi:diguanylate cyclase (GGDEF)-like protein